MMIGVKEQWQGFWSVYRTVLRAHGMYGESHLIPALWGDERLYTWLRVAMDGDSRHPLHPQRKKIAESRRLTMYRQMLSSNDDSIKGFARERLKRYWDHKLEEQESNLCKLLRMMS
jgi:hypothetical protein